MYQGAIAHPFSGERDVVVHGGGLNAAVPLRARNSIDVSSHDTLLFSIDSCINSKASSGFPSPPRDSYRASIGSFWPEGSNVHDPEKLDTSVLDGGEASIQALQQAVLSIVSSAGSPLPHTLDAEAVAAKLARAGWNVQLLLERSPKQRRRAANVPAMPFRPFLVVTGYTWGSVASETTELRAVVELEFRSQFELSLQRGVSMSYQCAQQELPEVFVGTPSQLRNAVVRMCRKMKHEFAVKDMSLPPWRSEASMLASWFPLEHRMSRHFLPPNVHVEG
jgi:uncharacterized protein (TIGR01615 family)